MGPVYGTHPIWGGGGGGGRAWCIYIYIHIHICNMVMFVRGVVLLHGSKVVGELSKLVVSSGALTQDDGSGKARLLMG